MIDIVNETNILKPVNKIKEKVTSVKISQYGVEEMAILSQFRENKDYCDVYLIAYKDNTTVTAHRVVLAMASEYFRGIFKEPVPRAKLLVPIMVPLKNISGTMLEQIVNFIYTGKIEIAESTVLEFFRYSQMFKLPRLFWECEKILMNNINLTNFMDYYKLASRSNCSKLLEAIKQFMDIKFVESEMEDSIAIKREGFYTYDEVYKCWMNLYQTTVLDYCAKTGKRVIYRKNEDEYTMISLDEPHSKKTVIHIPKNYGHPAVCITPTHVYVFGGKYSQYNNDPTGNGFAIHIITNKSKQIASMSVKRFGATAILHKNCIYVVGGRNEDHNTLADVEMFDTLNGQWSKMMPLNVARFRPVCIVHKQLLFAIGGTGKQSKAEFYNFATNLWKKIASLPAGFLVFSSVIIGDDIVVISYKGKSMKYDRDANKWNKFPTLD